LHLGISHSPSILFRTRAQARLEFAQELTVGKNEDAGNAMLPLDSAEVEHAAAVIVAAFLNPGRLNYCNVGIGNYFDSFALLEKVNWEYKRFAEASADRQRVPGRYFEETCVGSVSKPMTLVNCQGIIFLWYLPGIVLPHRMVCSAVPVHNPTFLLTLQSGGVKQKHEIS
jgi:hypothetical protein